jgi:hypothetical protein
MSIVIPIISEFKGKGFKDAEKATSALDKNLKRLAVTLGTALSTRKIAQFAKASVMAASDLEEAITKASVVFGRGSAEVEAFAKSSAQSLGISSAAALEAAGTYGNLFQAFGIGQREAQGMSTTLVQLAADMASFNNTSIDQALTAISSGLSGQSMPLKRYGVALQDVRLKAEAFSMGLIKSTKEALTPAAKAQAAYAIILRDTALAQGDFALTSGGVANSLKILSASATNAQTIIGTKLIESMDLLIDRKDGVEALAKSFEDMGTYVGNVALGLAEIGKSLKTLFGLLPGGGFSGRDLLQGIPVIGSYIELIQKLGEKSSAAKETKQAMLARALAKEQGMLASRNFKIQKNTTQELDKQNKLKKDSNKLDKAGSMLDLEKIQIEAALQNNLTDNERLRLQLMKALVNENASRAEYLAKELEKSQNSIAQLKTSLTEFKPSSPFDDWIDAIERMRLMLSSMGAGSIGMPQAPVSPSAGSPTLSNDLGVGYVDDFMTRDPSTGTKIEVYVSGTGGLDAETKQAVVDAVVEASAGGYSTGWYRTTGLLSPI